MTGTFNLEAMNLYDSINIKGVRSLVSGKMIQSSPQELQIAYGESSFLFIYRFGCLVFFNVPREKSESEIERLRAALGSGVSNPTFENYQITLGDGPPKVEFEYAQLKKPTIESVGVIAVVVGQSAALEYFELQTDRMLADTSEFTSALSRGKRPPIFRQRKLLSIIGSTANTRQHIISYLAILDAPEVTWKSKEIGKLYAEVRENFDIETRFRILDRKLSLIQDNIEILTELIFTQRSVMLEGLVVILIVFEIIMAFFKV